MGVGGWTFAPWRTTFYPRNLAHKDELAHAAARLSAIEINGTFYRTQTPQTFAKWRDAVPKGFVFTVKAPRFAVNRKVLGQAGESIVRFTQSGLTELEHTLGPILWQFAETKRFDADDFAAFLDLLPREANGMTLRHAVELRHESFCVRQAVDLARARRVAIVRAMDSDYPQIADPTADFCYVRMMGTRAGEPLGYSDAALRERAAELTALSNGKAPTAPLIGPLGRRRKRDVFAFVISGHKAKNPMAAMALMDRIG